MFHTITNKLSYYADSIFCILLQLHVYDKITDRGTNYLAPLSVIFLLTLLRFLRWQSSFRFPPLQFRQLGFHLHNQHLKLLLALLTGMGVDIAGVLFAIDPHGRVAALPQVWTLLADIASACPAAVRQDGLEIGHSRPFGLTCGTFFSYR